MSWIRNTVGHLQILHFSSVSSLLDPRIRIKESQIQTAMSMPTNTVTHSGVILSCSRASPAVHPAAAAGSPATFRRPVWMRALIILSCSRASPAVRPAAAVAVGSRATFHRPVWMRAAVCPAAAPPYPASPGRRNPWAIPRPAMRTAS
jgi:hypothetical protein